MPFNPDAFLAETPATEVKPVTGFDPDVFLAKDQTPEEQANQLQSQDTALQEKYGDAGQQALAGAEAAGRSLTFGLSSGVERALGVKPEDIRGREEANPITSTIGTVGGLLSPVGEAAVLTKAGKALGEKLVPRVVNEGIMAGASREAVKLATENALYQSGDETSKMILNDPDQSIGTAITNIGLASVVGGGFGAGLGAVSPLWKATLGSKASQFAEDFRGRLKEHLDNPEPVEGLVQELKDYHKSITDIADEVYGPKGLKTQEISKLMPAEITPKINESMNNIALKTEEAMKEMHKNAVPERYMNKYIQEVNRFNEAATQPGATPAKLFEAAQELKQTLQGYSKGNFGPFAVPSYHEAYDFLKITKNLGHDIRTSLENPSVWGKAAERQQAINSAFSKYLPSLKDFEKRFMSEVNGERVIDPGKIATYIKQVGKPNAELKQQMLQNFVDASEKYKQVLNDTHANLGVESPITTSSTNHIMNSLKEQTHGAKLADLFVKKFGDTAGKLTGGAIGGIAGAMTHIPGAALVGTLLGEHAVGPFLSSILPALAKPLVEKMGSGEGLKAAAEYGSNIVKGQKLTDSVIKNLFKAGSKTILPDTKQPSKESRKKIESALQRYQQDPSQLASVGGALGHYLPNHALQLGAVTQNAVSFLNSIKPQSAAKAPLDPPQPISKAVQSQYDRALDIAQQPLIVFDSIKTNTLTSHDIMALQTLYPGLYAGLRQKVMSGLVDAVSKGVAVPYDTRLGLSLFLQRPLDSTMTPISIISAQPGPEQTPQSPSNEPAPKKLSQGASSTMNKGVKLAQTQGQASQSMHQSDKA